MTDIPAIKLSENSYMPLLGLGTFKEKDENVMVNAVKAAIQSGYRHFDCAYVYHNEQFVGKAIHEEIANSGGKLKREDFFITTKCWNTYHSHDRAKKSLNESLERLGTDYVDLYLCHWPMGYLEGDVDFPFDANGKAIPSDISYIETYQAMEELVDEGKAKNIGVSNFNIAQLKDIINIARIRPVCNQFEVHPLLQNHELVDFCQSNNIVVTAYAPLGAGDRSWAKSDDPVPLKHPRIVQLAEKHNKTTAQVILRWLIQRNIVVIPKSVTPSRIHENAQLFDFNLSDEDMAVFKEFTEQFRFYVVLAGNTHKYYPF